ncbi:MAG: signal peptidase I [Verrucomicrobia bacterium]|nr:MAG: signal peptidase I [Verrucomicrobiota bacterium]
MTAVPGAIFRRIKWWAKPALFSGRSRAASAGGTADAEEDMILRWFLSRTVRRAINLCAHVRKTVNSQRDVLSEPALENIAAAIAAVQAVIAPNADKKLVKDRLTELEKAAHKWLQPYPHASLRENVEVVLVAAAIALAIHTFFLKPFKIPSGSMQPTLYGITSENLLDEPEARIPAGLARFIDFLWRGTSYLHAVAETDGVLEAFEPPKTILPFVKRQRIKVGGQWYVVWSSVDHLLERAGVERRHFYRTGDDIIKLKVTNGDHLFVDRLTYNFRRPKRGEIIVFETKGILSPITRLPAMDQDQFYIKRLVAMGGERVRSGNDRHVIINGQRLDPATPRFENAYSFDPKPPPRENQYSGHLNEAVAARYGKSGIAPLFPDEKAEVAVRPNHYMVMGDNTVNSSDSRTWGDFSRTNVIGKYGFVYWPFSTRFGWTAR